MNKIYLFLALTLLVLGCNQKTVEQDMDDYCACKSRHRQTDNDFKECSDLMTEIAKKYEFDPGAADFIQKRLKTCE